MISDEILNMVHAFNDNERKDILRDMAAKVSNMEDFIKDCRDDFDCDKDAHKYGTMCRACAALRLLPHN